MSTNKKKAKNLKHKGLKVNSVTSAALSHRNETSVITADGIGVRSSSTGGIARCVDIDTGTYKETSEQGETEGTIPVLAAAGRPSTPAKNIDTHPLQCGHSVLVAYRDTSHRLAKVSTYTIPVTRCYMISRNNIYVQI